MEGTRLGDIRNKLAILPGLEEQLEKLRRLERDIGNIIVRLAKRKAQIGRDINKVEYEKKDLIISGPCL